MSVTSVGQGNGALGQPSWANTTINEINACLEKGQWAKARMKIISMPGSAFCSGANNAFKVWEIPAAVVLTLGQVVGGKGSPYYNLRVQVKNIARALVSFFEGLSIVMAMPVLLAKPKLVRDLHRGLGLEWQPAVTPPPADSVTTSEPVVVKKPVERAASPTLSSSLSLATSEKFQKVAAAVKPIANNVLATGTQFIQRMRKDPQFATKVALSVAAFGVVGRWLLSGTTVVEPPREPLTPEPLTPEPLTPEPLTPEPLTPEPLTPEPLTPEPLTPEPLTPEPLYYQPIGPEIGPKINSAAVALREEVIAGTCPRNGEAFEDAAREAAIHEAAIHEAAIRKVYTVLDPVSFPNFGEMLPKGNSAALSIFHNRVTPEPLTPEPLYYQPIGPEIGPKINSTAVALRDEVIAGTCPIDGEAFEDAIWQAAMREAAIREVDICQVYTILDPVSFSNFERMWPEKSSAVALREEVIAGTCRSFNGRDLEPNALTSIPSVSSTVNVSSVVSELVENLDNRLVEVISSDYSGVGTVVSCATAIASMVFGLKFYFAGKKPPAGLGGVPIARKKKKKNQAPRAPMSNEDVIVLFAKEGISRKKKAVLEEKITYFNKLFVQNTPTPEIIDKIKSGAWKV